MKTKNSFKIKMFGQEFNIIPDPEKRTTRAILYFNKNPRLLFKGIAFCSKEDTFSIKIGAILAIKRALSNAYSTIADSLSAEVKSWKSIKSSMLDIIDKKLIKIGFTPKGGE